MNGVLPEVEYSSDEIRLGAVSATSTVFDVQRATPIRTLLRSFGRIFDSSVGSEYTYALSEPARRIDWFVSHTWATPRVQKFFILAMFFNGNLALRASFLSMLTMCLLTSVGAFPLFEYSGSSFVEEKGVYCTVVGSVIFVFFIVFGHAAPSCRQEHVFLDKVCIHQTDEKLKRRGIENLSAVLSSSRGMLVLYTDRYLQRLWTVFEIASTLLVQSENFPIVLMPVSLAPLILGGHVVGLCLGLSLILINTSLVYVTLGLKAGGAIQTLVTIAICLPAIVLQCRECARIDANMMSFTIHNAKCNCEADRQCVKRCIINFLILSNVIDQSATDEDALCVFDNIVHNELPKLLATHFQMTHTPYRFVFMMNVALFGWVLDGVGATLRQSSDNRKILLSALGLIMPMFMIPNCFILMRWNAGWALRSSGPREVLVTILISLFTFIETLGLFFLSQTLEKKAFDSDLYLCVHLFGAVVQACITWKLYGRRLGALQKHSQAFARKSVRRSYGNATEPLVVAPSQVFPASCDGIHALHLASAVTEMKDELALFDCHMVGVELPMTTASLRPVFPEPNCDINGYASPEACQSFQFHCPISPERNLDCHFSFSL